MICVFVNLLTLLPIIFCQDKGSIIKIQNGYIQGSKMAENLYSFRGIPYAKPPIDELRFEAPQEADSWNGIWNATYDRSDCYQIGLDSPLSIIVPDRANGEEDCLYINVYTPQLPKRKVMLPVMVWIYGGGFLYGTSKYTSYAPDDIVKQGVIVVSFNYRVGVFGFLSTGDEVAPGNVAIKDQILALKWIQNNIRFFGGDPRKVTIFGESAGAASVSYLTISPLAKGLFKSAIMESGSALCLWSLSRTAREAAFRIGNDLEIHTNDSQVLVNELKKVPAESLLKTAQRVMSLIFIRKPLAGLVYAPVIEVPSENAALTKSSYELLSEGQFNQVPTIIGYNSAEAEGFAEIISLLETYLVQYDLMPSQLIPINMNVEESFVNIVGEVIKNYYAGDDGQLSTPNSDFKAFMSDDQFVRPIQRTAMLMSFYTDVYLYRFSYTSEVNSVGAAHADELEFLFQSTRNTTDDKLIRRCMIKLWTNFVKSNNPTPSSRICSGDIKWKPINRGNRKQKYFININRNSILGKDPNWGDMTFWEDLYDNYGNPPYDTF